MARVSLARSPGEVRREALAEALAQARPARKPCYALSKLMTAEIFLSQTQDKTLPTLQKHFKNKASHFLSLTWLLQTQVTSFSFQNKTNLKHQVFLTFP
jgi:hypothetical protein